MVTDGGPTLTATDAFLLMIAFLLAVYVGQQCSKQCRQNHRRALLDEDAPSRGRRMLWIVPLPFGKAYGVTTCKEQNQPLLVPFNNGR
tara:strand:- start:760 stop:1023 length:264 start_codon:yes stop_codon:yes gene_type:complete